LPRSSAVYGADDVAELADRDSVNSIEETSAMRPRAGWNGGSRPALATNYRVVKRVSAE